MLSIINSFFTASVNQQTVKPQKAEQMQKQAENSLPVVYDQLHVAQSLDKLLAKGGEGEIYPLVDRPQVLVKKYSAQVLLKEGAYLEKKIEAMRQIRPLFKDHNMSWPAISVYD